MACARISSRVGSRRGVGSGAGAEGCWSAMGTISGEGSRMGVGVGSISIV